jgi:hypothetical protein
MTGSSLVTMLINLGKKLGSMPPLLVKFGSTPTTLYFPSPVPYRATDQPQSDQLNFLPFAEREEGGATQNMVTLL